MPSTKNAILRFLISSVLLKGKELYSLGRFNPKELKDIWYKLKTVDSSLKIKKPAENSSGL